MGAFCQLLMLLLAVGAIRLTAAGGEVSAAARAGARAAAAAGDPVAGRLAAEAVVGEVLADRAIACRRLTVDTSVIRLSGSVPDARAGPGVGPDPGIGPRPLAVEVRVSCLVHLGDVGLVGLPGSHTATRSARDVLDVFRGGSRGGR